MSEGDRPGNGDARAGSPTGAVRDGGEPFKLDRGRRRGLAASPPTPPLDPFGALERQVEEALTTRELDGGATNLALLRSVVDGTLTTVARLRRTKLHETVGALAGLGSDPTSLFRTLYRYWWRVETFGLERVPPRGRVIRKGSPVGRSSNSHAEKTPRGSRLTVIRSRPPWRRADDSVYGRRSRRPRTTPSTTMCCPGSASG